MRILSFSVFKDKIKDGTKSTTIRRPWKRPLRLGETLQAVWKTRSKNREVLGTVKITKKMQFRFCDLDSDQLYTIALNDGFPTLMAMLKFFRTRYGADYSIMDFELITFEFTPLHQYHVGD